MMISYKEALKRHDLKPLYTSYNVKAEWKEVLVGSKEFWDQITTGKLVAFDDVAGEYVGIVDEYDFQFEYGTLWIFYKPDPTRTELREGQETIPVCFSPRDKIMIECI